MIGVAAQVDACSSVMVSFLPHPSPHCHTSPACCDLSSCTHRLFFSSFFSFFKTTSWKECMHFLNLRSGVRVKLLVLLLLRHRKDAGVAKFCRGSSSVNKELHAAWWVAAANLSPGKATTRIPIGKFGNGAVSVKYRLQRQLKRFQGIRKTVCLCSDFFEIDLTKP